MKILFIVLLSISSVSFAENKKSIAEMKSVLLESGLAGPNCKISLEKVSDKITCADLTTVLTECGIMPVDSDGKRADVAENVVCE